MRSMRKRAHVSFEEVDEDMDEDCDYVHQSSPSDDDEDCPMPKRSRVSSSRRGAGNYSAKVKPIYQKEWEKEFHWLSGDPDDPTHALCKICGKKIRAHKGDIEKHQKTKRHLKKQTTSDILADLIPISCGDGLNNGDDYSRHEENLDGTKNSEMDHSDARIVTHSGGPVSDGQQIIYFTESAVDTSQQNTNTIIDKLVEKYHQKRIENLKVEHEATLELNKEQLGILKQQLEGEATLNDNKNTLAREEHEIRLKFLQREHEAKLKAIEDERDARLRAIEQELLYARQEYEKKMRLLDVQLSSMKEPNSPRTDITRTNGHFSVNSNRIDIPTGSNYIDTQSGPKPGENHLHILNPHLTRADMPPGSNQCLY